jgi:hypothetical protein
MSSKVWAATKIAATAGVIVFGVSIFAGPQATANVAATVAQGTAWGVGVLGGSAKYVGPGFQSGMEEAGEPSGFDGLSNEIGKKAGADTAKKAKEANPKLGNN